MFLSVFKFVKFLYRVRSREVAVVAILLAILHTGYRLARPLPWLKSANSIYPPSRVCIGVLLRDLVIRVLLLYKSNHCVYTADILLLRV